MAGLMSFTPNEVLDEEKKAEAAASGEGPLPQPEIEISGLANYIRTAWETAKRAKTEVENRMLTNLRQYNSEYEPAKLAAIKELKSSEIFIPVTNMKCRAGEAWLREVIFQPGEKPWSIKPTPIPDLPEEIEKQIDDQASQLYQAMINQAASVLVPDNFAEGAVAIKERMVQSRAALEEFHRKAIENKSKEACDLMETQMDDQLTEGGFYIALEQCLHDIMVFPSCILKGPILRKDVSPTRILDAQGRWVSTVEEHIIPQFERRSPFDIYPAPGSKDINDGYVIDKSSITPKQLSDLKTVPGFSATAIDEVLSAYHGGRLREWTNIDSERNMQESQSSTSIFDTDKIDILEFWGDVKGEYLLGWGLTFAEIKDSNSYYSVCAWLIGNNVIKAMLNPDPLGKKPFAKASFIESADSFWGYSVPDVIRQLQGGCNSLARAIINNAAFSYGPFIERNTDRVSGLDRQLYPMKIFDATDSQMNSAPALRFYQSSMVGDKLLLVYQHFMKEVDELSGIPAYAHGDVTVGGAGRTASGFSMLSSNAARGIKAVIRNIDIGIIEPSIQRQYQYNLQLLSESPDKIPDMKIVARGSAALSEKELKTVRMNEFLQATANPFDINILGVEGRGYLLWEVAKANGMDVEKIFPNGVPTNPVNAVPQLTGPQPANPLASPASTGPGVAPPPNPEKTNPAGGSPNGGEVRQFNGAQ